MEERITAARPYALAVFKLARERGQLDTWSEMLGFLASAVTDPQMKALIANPKLERGRLAEIVLEVGGGRFTDEAQNLVRVLAANRRLDLAPEMARVFEAEKAGAERRQRVEVTSAYAVNAKFKQALADAMERRLGCAVELEVETDRALIGGVVIRAGDLVIDASLRGRIRQLGADLA